MKESNYKRKREGNVKGNDETLTPCGLTHQGRNDEGTWIRSGRGADRRRVFSECDRGADRGHVFDEDHRGALGVSRGRA